MSKNKNKLLFVVKLLLFTGLLVWLSLWNEEIYIEVALFVVPIYLGLMLLYRICRFKDLKNKYRWLDLICFLGIHWLYSFSFYLYNQIKLNEYCRLNDKPMEGEITGFFIITIFNVIILGAFGIVSTLVAVCKALYNTKKEQIKKT